VLLAYAISLERPHHDSPLRGSQPFFCYEQLTGVIIKVQFRYDALESFVFFRLRSQLGDVARVYPAVLCAPLSQRIRMDAMLARKLRRRRDGVVRFEDRNDLGFGEAGLPHVVLFAARGPDSTLTA